MRGVLGSVQQIDLGRFVRMTVWTDIEKRGHSVRLQCALCKLGTNPMRVSAEDDELAS